MDTLFGTNLPVSSSRRLRNLELTQQLKFVSCKVDIIEYQEISVGSGELITKSWVWEVLASIGRGRKLRLAFIRSMSLNQLASYPRMVNGTSKNEKDARQVLHQIGVADLIAMPMKWLFWFKFSRHMVLIELQKFTL